jgi:DMSO/TMAO reductase YedYZ molybdopterin-dependent catalytic subunit
MNRNQLLLSGFFLASIVVIVFFVGFNLTTQPGNTQDPSDQNFPDFFTKNEDYFVTRIGSVPNIDRETYQLEVKGVVDSPASFSLEELQALDQYDLPLTVECIGNRREGKLVSTALWRGFNVYDLLLSVGISENATGVVYMAADGYYVFQTLEQIQDNGVVGALYMNGVEIPPVQGFPLRILHPGFYGAEHIAWVTEIEVVDFDATDFWDDRGWDTSPRMHIDSKVFFPATTPTLNTSQYLRVGGCAYGGTRVKKVEYTLDDGATWNNATIVQQIDADNVWVFWEINLTISEVGQHILQIKATDIFDNEQVKVDNTYVDGTNSWPILVINVV